MSESKPVNADSLPPNFLLQSDEGQNKITALKGGSITERLIYVSKFNNLL